VNLPASEKMAAPRYQDLRGADLPRRREPGVEIRLLSGRSGGVSSPTLNHVPVAAIDARMDDGASVGLRLTLRIAKSLTLRFNKPEIFATCNLIIAAIKRSTGYGGALFSDRKI
jgi:hypothetical protein